MQKNAEEEKEQNKTRVLNIKNGTFILLVVSVNVARGSEYETFCARLKEIIAKNKIQFNLYTAVTFGSKKVPPTLHYLINVYGRLLFSEKISRVDALIRWWTIINFLAKFQGGRLFQCGRLAINFSKVVCN